jgi:predicted DCC family thiol-disulfide oxidoreductase YuxK
MKIVFFDGYCNLCNSLVDWLIKVDRSSELKFASLQGLTASKTLTPALVATPLDTVIYFTNGHTYLRSTAILKILWDLKGVWKLSGVFLIIPAFLRDVVYNIIARNRYRLFGKRDTCRLPTAEEKLRFLE